MRLAAVLALALSGPVAGQFDSEAYADPFASGCQQTKEQSPINLFGGTLNPAPGKVAPTIKFPTVTKPKWINKGSTLQVRHKIFRSVSHAVRMHSSYGDLRPRAVTCDYRRVEALYATLRWCQRTA